MKYIISEQRLERIVNKYLNTLDLTEEERYGNRLNLINHNMSIEDNQDEDRKIVISYHYDDEKLFIKFTLIDDIYAIFSLPEKEIMNYVRNWFQDKYNKEVMSVKSFFYQIG
jgi:hypothetical protein